MCGRAEGARAQKTCTWTDRPPRRDSPAPGPIPIAGLHPERSRPPPHNAVRLDTNAFGSMPLQSDKCTFDNHLPNHTAGETRRISYYELCYGTTPHGTCSNVLGAVCCTALSKDVGGTIDVTHPVCRLRFSTSPSSAVFCTDGRDKSRQRDPPGSDEKQREENDDPEMLVSPQHEAGVHGKTAYCHQSP